MSSLRRYVKRRMQYRKAVPSGHNAQMAHKKPPKSSELKKAVCARFKAAGQAYTRVAADLARMLDINPKQLSGYYTGRNYPDEAIIVKFCDLTGCTTDWIYRGIMDAKMPLETAVHIAMAHPDLVKKSDAVPTTEEVALAVAGLQSEPE